MATGSMSARPAGYTALVEQYRIEVIPNWHRSQVATGGTHRIRSSRVVVEEIYPASYWPGDSIGDQLEFALKYDGTNLGILASVFEVVKADEFARYVRSKPTGKYARRLWFLYELLTGKTLPLDGLTRGNYVDLLDPDDYYALVPGRAARRQRIRDNLLGNREFCPMIRRTDRLKQFEHADLAQRSKDVISAVPPALLKRALSYLYTKETKSSFEIEHATPSSTRSERFVRLLQLAETEDFLDKPHLLELQNRIVDPRFCDIDYRSTQNYVGETVAWQRENVHYASPKPDDLHSLMEGLIAAHGRIDHGEISAVAHAAAIAYGLVFLHPFEDGNGRIHRFLIHNILARRGFTPQGIMFPVSAAMLENRLEYDASLEAFSRALMPLVEHSLDEEGRMTIHNETAKWYRYIDMTPQTEALYAFIEQTIDKDLVDELAFLVNYDQSKRAIQKIVDMPDRQIDLLIRFCLQNNNRLSARKRARYFDFLSDEEISRLERVIESAYEDATPSSE